MHPCAHVFKYRTKQFETFALNIRECSLCELGEIERIGPAGKKEWFNGNLPFKVRNGVATV